MHPTSQLLRDTADLLDAHAPTPDALRALHAARNAIEAIQARLVVEMTEHLDHESEGFSTPKAWLRNQLGIDTRHANDLIAAGPTLKQLPEATVLAEAGQISLQHVKHLTYSLRHVGESTTREFLPRLLDVAAKTEPAALRTAVRKLREAAYPDALDQAWIDGMAREDIIITPVPDGMHINGFLNSTTGAKFKTLLNSLSAPNGADDKRTSAQRRVDGLEELLERVLANGLPGDQGVRPHLTITVDVETLKTRTGSADLVGYGAIGIRQIQEILCESEITPVVTDQEDTVLDVGRTSRLAKPRQRTAIEVQQRHQCAAPGCQAPIIHIHHIIWWSQGGPTDLANLIGLCPRCHRAVHAGTLTIDPDTREFNAALTRRPRRRNPRRQFPNYAASHPPPESRLPALTG